MYPLSIGRQKVPFLNSGCRISNVYYLQRAIGRRAIEVLKQVSRSVLLKDHHLVDRSEPCAVSCIYSSEKYRTRRIRQVDDVNTATVAASEVATITNDDRFK